MKVSSSNKAEKNTLVSDNHNLFLLVVFFTLNLVAGTTEGVNRPSVQELCEYENINTNIAEVCLFDSVAFANQYNAFKASLYTKKYLICMKVNTT